MFSFLHLLDPFFLTSWFAWAGIALVSIPIIIHLLNRRRFKTVTWAAMEFLLRAMRKNRRRLKFEQWLLLATRCLLLILLGMALARPLGCENGALAQFGRHTALNVFIIDNSYSADYADTHPDTKTHLAQAKKIVKSLLSRAASGGESVVIITAATPSTAVVVEPLLDMETARQAVDNIQQSWNSTDLRHAMELALDVARRNEKQPNKNLYILSDSTRSAWEGADSATFKQLGPELASTYKITHFNLSAGQAQWNGAILDIKPVDPLVTTKFKSDFKADVRGYFPGLDTGHEATLQWKLDDQPIDKATRSTKISEASKPQELNDVQFLTGGPHVLTLNLVDETDRLTVDNVRNRVIDVASELKVLIVEGKRELKALGGSGDFLNTALAGHREIIPGKPPISDSSFAPEVINDLELGNKVLGDYSSVLLAGVGQISPAESDSLKTYVRQGGTLVFFMSDSVDKENYNSLLYKRNKILPGELVKVMRVGTNEKEYSFDFAPNKPLHPLLNVFANTENTGLDRVRVFAYWQMELPPDSGTERVLNYVPSKPGAPADPAIVVSTVGQGRVIFVSTSANEDWTNFSGKRCFPEVVHELLSGSVRTGDWWMNRTVGEHLAIPSSVRMTSAPILTDAAGGSVVVSPPEPETAAVTDASTGSKSEKDAWRGLYHTEELTKPGIYMLSLGDHKVPIAVNPPAADEANVTTITDDAIRRALGDINLTMVGADLPSEAAAGRDRNDFSWWTMMLVLALIGFECFIAMKFGHNRRSEIATGDAVQPAHSLKPAGSVM